MNLIRVSLAIGHILDHDILRDISVDVPRNAEFAEERQIDIMKKICFFTFYISNFVYILKHTCWREGRIPHRRIHR